MKVIFIAFNHYNEPCYFAHILIDYCKHWCIFTHIPTSIIIIPFHYLIRSYCNILKILIYYALKWSFIGKNKKNIINIDQLNLHKFQNKNGRHEFINVRFVLIPVLSSFVHYFFSLFFINSYSCHILCFMLIEIYKLINNKINIFLLIYI